MKRQLDDKTLMVQQLESKLDRRKVLLQNLKSEVDQLKEQIKEKNAKLADLNRSGSDTEWLATGESQHHEGIVTSLQAQVSHSFKRDVYLFTTTIY